jgi:hypothetical protein
MFPPNYYNERATELEALARGISDLTTREKCLDLARRFRDIAIKARNTAVGGAENELLPTCSRRNYSFRSTLDLDRPVEVPFKQGPAIHNEIFLTEKIKSASSSPASTCTIVDVTSALMRVPSSSFAEVKIPAHWLATDGNLVGASGGVTFHKAISSLPMLIKMFLSEMLPLFWGVSKRRSHDDEHDHHQGRHGNFLQGLGP